MTESAGAASPLILGIGGGLGGESQSLIALKAALSGAEKAGARIDLVDLQTVRLPMLEPDRSLEDSGPVIADFVSRIAAANGFLWSSPAYHGTLSGVMKNTLDYFEFLSRRTPPYIDGRPVGLISTAAGSMAGVTTIQSMIHVAHSLRAWVVPLNVPIHNAWRVIDKSGRITDSVIEERLHLLGGEVARFITGGRS